MDNPPHQLAGLMADDRLRWLMSLLAEEGPPDRRMLWRLGSWAAGTVGALTLSLLTVHWSDEGHRGQTAVADLARQSQQVQAVARDALAENRKLTAEVATLNSDRDRLYARVTVLEQGLESVTGTVSRQTGPASLALASAEQPINLMPPVIAAPPVVPAQMPGQASVQGSVQGSSQGSSHGGDPPAPSQATAAAAPPATPPAAATAHPAPPPQAAAAPAPEEPARMSLSSSTLYAPPDPAAPRMIGNAPTPPAAPDPRDGTQNRPDKGGARAEFIGPRLELQKDAKSDPKLQIAAAVPAAPQKPPAPPVMATAMTPAAQPTAEIPAARTEFGVDLGGANSIEGLRGLWQGLLKADAALLSPLRPIISIRERSNGLGMQLRLVAGPFSDAAAAARVCAALAENDRSCETSVFEGQRLTARAEVAPPPTAAAPTPTIHPVPVRTVARPASASHHHDHAAAHPIHHEEHHEELPAPAPTPPATTQSTPAPSLLPEFLRNR